MTIDETDVTSLTRLLTVSFVCEHSFTDLMEMVKEVLQEQHNPAGVLYIVMAAVMKLLTNHGLKNESTAFYEVIDETIKQMMEEK